MNNFVIILKGHIDFYPNGGNNQPQCDMFDQLAKTINHCKSMDFPNNFYCGNKLKVVNMISEVLSPFVKSSKRPKTGINTEEYVKNGWYMF